MATTWTDRTNYDKKKSWLLADGNVVEEPPLEETTSGRKVRIKGTEVSMFSKDVDDLIFQGVKMLADTRKTKVWLSLDESARQSAEDNIFGTRVRKGARAALHLLKSADGSGTTTAWWRFRHDTLPIEALLVAELTKKYSYRHQSTEFDVVVRLVHQSTTPNDAESVVMVSNDNPILNGQRARLTTDQRLRFDELLRDNKPEFLNDVTLGTTSINGERQAVKTLLNMVRKAEGLSEVLLPDLRDEAKYGWLELGLHDTNVNGDFLQSMADYLDGSGIMAEVKEHYDSMRRLLRTAGVVLSETTENDLNAALAGGDPLTVKVETQPAEAGHMHDHAHSLTLNLATGTFIVNCGNAPTTNNDVIAHKWEEAVTMASLTGQEDELLAYARRYKETEGERRAEQILKERSLDD